jgi:hypothetical protein
MRLLLLYHGFCQKQGLFAKNTEGFLGEGKEILRIFFLCGILSPSQLAKERKNDYG